MDVQSESAEPPPGEAQPAGKTRKGFKLFGKRKPGSIFSSIRKGEANSKPPIARSTTLDGLTENTAPDPEQEHEKEQVEKAAEANPGENGQAEDGSMEEDGVPSASPPRMSICSTTSVKSLGFMSLLRGGGRSRGAGDDRRVQTVSHPTGRQRRGLKNLFSGVSFRHKDKDEAAPPSPLLMSSRTGSVEIIKEQMGLTPKPPPRCLDDPDSAESDTETSDPASRLTPHDSPSTTLSETTASQAPVGKNSETTEDVPPPVPTTAPPPLEPGETSLSNLLADISSLLTFDSISSGGDFMADVEAEWGKVSPVRAGEKLSLPSVSPTPASPSAKPSCPPAATSTAKPTSVSTFLTTQPTSIITTKPSSSTTHSVKFNTGPTLASEPTATPTAPATITPLTVTVTVPVPSPNYSPSVMSSFSKGFPPFKPAPTTTVTTKPFTAPVTSTSDSSPVMSPPSAITAKPTPCPAPVTIPTPSVTPPASVLSTATAKSIPEAAPNIASKPYPVPTPNVAASPLTTPNITPLSKPISEATPTIATIPVATPSITPVSKPSLEATPNIATRTVATPDITPVNKPSPVATPNITMSPVAKPNIASVIKQSPEATPPPSISKSPVVTLSSATVGLSSDKPNLTPAVTSQPPSQAPVASSKMPTCPMPAVAPDSPLAAPLQPKAGPGPLGLTRDAPSLDPTADTVIKAPLDVAPITAPISSTKPQHVPSSTPLSLEKTTTLSSAPACLDKMAPERITAQFTTTHTTAPVPITVPAPTPPLPSFTPTPTPIHQSETPPFKPTAPVLNHTAPTRSPLLGEPLTSPATVKANGQTNGGLVIPKVTDSRGGQTVPPKYEELPNESRASVQAAPSKEKRTVSKIPIVGGGRGGKLPLRDNQHVDDGSDGSLDPPTPVLEEERPRLGLHEAGVKSRISDSEISRHSQEESQSQPHPAKAGGGLPRESKIPVKHGAPPSHSASQIPQAREPPRTKIPVSKVPVRRAGNKPAAAGMSSQIRK